MKETKTTDKDTKKPINPRKSDRTTMRAAFLHERSISAKGSASAETKALKKANISFGRSRT
jgi:hypothetical protein